jgi:hypothetical protein
MKRLVFKRNSGGNYYARAKGGTGLTVYKTQDGRWQWRVWHSKGRLTISEQTFGDEDAALDNLLDTLTVASAIDL